MCITKKDIALLFGASLFLLPAGMLGWLSGSVGYLAFLAVLCTLLVLTVLLEIYRRLAGQIDKHTGRLREEHRDLQKRNFNNFRQTESLIFSTLELDLPIPDTRSWAASPDLLKKLTEIILEEKPDFIVEASSGVSTLVIAYCLKRLGKGKVLSLEHDERYVKKSQNLISFHGLDNIATVVLAPLKETVINDTKWLWYDLDYVSIDQPIDLLVIDGPPVHVQKLSRYPALPLLQPHLSDNALIILDDGIRDDEKEIVEAWANEFQDFSSEYINLEKGAYLLHRSSHA
jgi:predicted O-methyltransferase YrrM